MALAKVHHAFKIKMIMNANIMTNTISNQEFRELLEVSKVKNPEGKNEMPIISRRNRMELLALYKRSQDELTLEYLIHFDNDKKYQLTDHQMETLQKYMSDKSDEFAEKDANYMSVYESAISNGWGYGN